MTLMDKAMLSRQLLLWKDLEEVLEAFESAGVPCLALKGAVFAGTLYERPDLRPMEDLDLWVGPGRLAAAEAALAARGYVRERDNPTTWVRGRTKVDLEDGPWYMHPEDREAAWGRAIELGEDGPRLRTLAWEDHFVFLVAHSAAHHGWWDPAHLEDLRRFLALGLDWPEVGRRLDRGRLVAAAAASLELAGLRAPEGLELPLGRWGRLEAAAFGWALRRGPLPGVNYLLRWWTSPSRAGHLAAWLFPGAAFLRRRYATRHPGFYLLLRPLFLLREAWVKTWEARKRLSS